MQNVPLPAEYPCICVCMGLGVTFLQRVRCPGKPLNGWLPFSFLAFFPFKVAFLPSITTTKDHEAVCTTKEMGKNCFVSYKGQKSYEAHQHMINDSPAKESHHCKRCLFLWLGGNYAVLFTKGQSVDCCCHMEACCFILLALEKYQNPFPVFLE